VSKLLLLLRRIVTAITGGRRARDRMDLQLHVQSVSIATKVSSNPVSGEVYSIQHYVITFVSD